MRKRSICILCLTVLALFCFVGTALAAVNLEWRPSQQTVNVGDYFWVGLYATRSDPGQAELISALDVIVHWDTQYLDFWVLGDPQPMWLTDGFFTDAPDGINDDVTDGDVLYQAWAMPGETVAIPEEGLLCVDWQFKAIEATELTQITIPLTFGQGCQTVVWDGVEPNHDITGTRGAADVEILVPEPATFLALGFGLVPFVLRRRSRP